MAPSSTSKGRGTAAKKNTSRNSKSPNRRKHASTSDTNNAVNSTEQSRKRQLPKKSAVSKEEQSRPGGADASKTKQPPTTRTRPNMRRNIVREFVLLNPMKKALVYLAIVLVGSTIYEVTTPPKTLFADKNNYLNQYFVKWSWGWTLSALSLYIIPSSFVVRKGDIKRIAKDYFRLLVGTAQWFCWVKLFFWIEDLTGECYDINGEKYTRHTTKYPCVKAGHMWDGIDISGHTFLLTHCSLIIFEELHYYLKLFEATRKLGKSKGKKKGQPKKDLLTSALNGFSQCMMLVLLLMTLLWEFMLICTQIYFHTIGHKIFAFVISLINWLVTYRVVYKKLYPDMHS
ncbi:acyl-coenzyme A diphosphatase FITM2-like [Saccoglossus kowalevskii]|uniref:FIT family protein CG10671-like n=1 Tax=Saccoglossus kowalevskii TaxID=10224 RepID=A0ABM0M8W2_SACKO|nr:PREDICTED: FIT family protein CG10671-like [Saccoglossus kowalevskii]